jgi:hypothetical protein
MAEENKDILTKEGLIAHLAELKTGLETTLKTEVKDSVVDSIKEKMEAIDAMAITVKELQDSATKPEVLAKLQEDMATTIKAFDLLQSRMKGFKFGGEKKSILTVGEALGEKLSTPGAIEDIEKQLKSAGGSAVLKLGPVSLKDMTVASTLTGDPVATYNQRQAIIPSQKVNFRDLIPTVQSPTGLYVTYKENAGETNNIAVQTDGVTKGQNEYALTEVKTVSNYIAGFAVFTKQLLKNLPFMQGTLTRMLLRDFYKKENAHIFTAVSGAATGSTSAGTSPDDIKQLIALIGAQLDTDFNVSFVVVSNQTLARLISDTYSTGYYPGAGSVVLSDGRGITIFGVPVVGASWVTANYALMIDSEYLERVEVEGLNIAFSFEDSVNFRQNKVTARVECMEEVNLMMPQSAIYMNLGAS